MQLVQKPRARVTCGLSNRSRAFTLIQLLVAIGIIVILVALALPAIVHARKQAMKTAAAMNLQAIATALEAYKADFGDYPRPEAIVKSGGSYVNVGMGPTVLAMALVGPGPASTADGTNMPLDGNDGPGFRIRSATSGRVYGPYLQPDKFKFKVTAGPQANPSWTGVVSDSSNGNQVQIAIIEPQSGQPILYAPASPAKRSLPLQGSYCDDSTVSQGYATPIWPRYDFAIINYNNSADANNLSVPSLSAMQSLLGAQTSGTTGAIISGHAEVNEPFFLWLAGTDGIFGTADDVTNIP